MLSLDLTSGQLVAALLRLSETRSVSLLDSCGVGHQGSHLLVAGIDPLEASELSFDDPSATLDRLDGYISSAAAVIFTLAYDLGRKLIGMSPHLGDGAEPDAYVSTFDTLIVHDYASGETTIRGNPDKRAALADHLLRGVGHTSSAAQGGQAQISSDFSRGQYLNAIETIKERIRSGDTYQTNLTQKLTATLPDGLSAQGIFARLRRDHPAPFAAFITRPGSSVVSASPERFFRIDGGIRSPKKIFTSPIKGTRPRGETVIRDEELRNELLSSPKDRAENTMIVDLLRNDLGRVCEYGTVEVERLCEIEEHPTLFHLVSTISGLLAEGARFSDVIRSLFPCGSITGAPKISTMRIIDKIENSPRGLSMGAIGCSIPDGFGQSPRIDLSVAIRTMVIRGREAEFSVGGGIVIDSEPEQEYEESLLKARALIAALS